MANTESNFTIAKREVRFSSREDVRDADIHSLVERTLQAVIDKLHGSDYSTLMEKALEALLTLFPHRGITGTMALPTI